MKHHTLSDIALDCLRNVQGKHPRVSCVTLTVGDDMHARWWDGPQRTPPPGFGIVVDVLDVYPSDGWDRIASDRVMAAAASLSDGAFQ